MSIPEKIEYGGAPRTFNQSCLHGIEPQTAQYLADFLNNLAVSIYALGNPRIAGGSDAEDLPLSDPPRNRVRFKLTDGFSGGAAPAVGVDGTGGDVLTPAFTVYDPMGRYTSAGVGDYGIASYYQYPNGVYRLEVDVLGGEGTVTGTANDEKVKVTGDDTLEKHLLQCIYNADGTLPGAVSATVVTGAALPAGYQEVFAQEVTDTPNDERMRLVTSSASATETYKVKCNDADDTPDFLHPTLVFATTQDYDGDIHVAINNATNPGELVSANQTEWLYLQKANLEWLAGDGLTWDESNPNDVHIDATPTNYTAKLTSDVPARVGIRFGQLSGVALGWPDVNGDWQQQLTDQIVFNPSMVELHVASEIYAPVTYQDGQWVLNPTELPQVTGWAASTEMHVVQCSSGTPQWAADAPITSISSQASSTEDCTDLTYSTYCQSDLVGPSFASCGITFADCDDPQTVELTYVTSVSCVDGDVVYETDTRSFIICPPP